MEVRRSSVRRLVALIEALPPESALGRVQVEEIEEESEPHVITSLDEFGSWLHEHA